MPMPVSRTHTSSLLKLPLLSSYVGSNLICKYTYPLLVYLMALPIRFIIICYSLSGSEIIYFGTFSSTFILSFNPFMLDCTIKQSTIFWARSLNSNFLFLNWNVFDLKWPRSSISSIMHRICWMAECWIRMEFARFFLLIIFDLIEWSIMVLIPRMWFTGVRRSWARQEVNCLSNLSSCFRCSNF